jgi:hypothetical protein
MSKNFGQFFCLTGRTSALCSPSRRLARRQTVRAGVSLSMHIE